MIARSTSTRSPRRLLVAIHDVAPSHEDEVDRLQAQLRAASNCRPALLVVPDFWGRDPIAAGSAFARRLRVWADEGAEIFLHGFVHKDEVRHTGTVARFRAKHMTASEGEFLGLTADEARDRIRRGRRLIEDITGRAITGFVAPAWLYGPGAHAALRHEGVAMAEDHWRVWQPADGTVLARSPVITWATRTPARMASSLLVAKLARTMPLPRIVRIGVHPRDVDEPAVLRSIAATVAKVARTHRPSSYAALRQDLACAS